MNNLWKERRWVLSGLLLLATVVTYLPALRGGLVFDDRPMIMDNPLVQARDGLHRFWLTTEAPDYYPLTWSFWWMQWHLWGKNTVGYHVVNILLHAANVLLIWLVLRRLRIPGAWLAALLFAVHPVNAGTVAWITEQKNTLSMLFFALSILWYLRFEEERREFWYGLALTAFLLALLSKSAVVMLPVVLLGCVWWLRGRLRASDLWRTVPFFALSLLLGLTTVWFQYHRVLNGREIRTGGIFSRLAVAGLAPWFYLGKAILPVNLCLIYPQWHPEKWGWSGCLPGIVLVAGFVLLWWKRDIWGRPWLFGFAYYVVMLVPVLGFVDQGFYEETMVADHWQYYSLVGVTALTAAGIVTLGRRQRLVVGLIAGAVVIALGTLSWQRCQIFHDEETLYTDTLLKNPLAWIAHNNLGNTLAQEGRTQEAIDHYREAIRISPNFADAHYNLGNALSDAGKIQEAIEQYEQALRLKPDFATAHYNLGRALVQAGQTPEAIKQYEQALRIDPQMAEAHNSLGIALAQAGKTPEAIGHFERALQISPDLAEAHNNLGTALSQTGRTQEAIQHFEQALRIRPNFADAHYNLGIALVRVGKIQEAIGHFEQAVRINPDFAAARTALKQAWLRATDPGNRK